MTHYSVQQETYELMGRRVQRTNVNSDNVTAKIFSDGDKVKSAPSHRHKEKDHVPTHRMAGYGGNSKGHTDIFIHYCS